MQGKEMKQQTKHACLKYFFKNLMTNKYLNGFLGSFVCNFFRRWILIVASFGNEYK
jgi:hypothetical protein